MAKLLLVEDNEAILLGLKYLLCEEGFTYEIARGSAEALQLFGQESFDLAILDIGLPDGNGFDLCRIMKKERDFPVIFLTAREEEKDVVKGFDLGADDYVVKPFRNRELISRIRNVLRRMGKDNEILCCQWLKLDTRTGKAYVDEREIQLSKLEYKILSILLNNQGKLFTRSEILADIWDVSGNFVNDNTLSVTIKRLREKIGDRDGRIIKTVRGMGYRIEKES